MPPPQRHVRSISSLINFLARESITSVVSRIDLRPSNLRAVFLRLTQGFAIGLMDDIRRVVGADSEHHAQLALLG
jgi:hypothetical protein